MTRYKVGYLIGSLSSTSINRKLAKALTRLAPEGLEFAEIPFRDLPLYTPDYDADFPPVAREFKGAIAACDARNAWWPSKSPAAGLLPGKCHLKPSLSRATAPSMSPRPTAS